jgi:hypothetical protein
VGKKSDATKERKIMSKHEEKGQEKKSRYIVYQSPKIPPMPHGQDPAMGLDTNGLE